MLGTGVQGEGGLVFRPNKAEREWPLVTAPRLTMLCLISTPAGPKAPTPGFGVGWLTQAASLCS